MNILAKLPQQTITTTAIETHNLAKIIAKQLPKDSILALYGELGTGKSTFTRGLAEAWQINGPINSPTYHFFNIYKGTRQLIHLDAYRLENPEDYLELMIEDYLSSPFCIVIEWPEKIGRLLPPNALRIYFEIIQDGIHRITVGQK
jgi:tRNA threonylcarbamoyladenosine biosynthesis protein TsaE